MVLNSRERVGRLNDIWLWLAGFRYYIDQLEEKGVHVNFEACSSAKERIVKEVSGRDKIKQVLIHISSNSHLVNKSLKSVRLQYRKLILCRLKKKMLLNYPPIKLQ